MTDLDGWDDELNDWTEDDRVADEFAAAQRRLEAFAVGLPSLPDDLLPPTHPDGQHRLVDRAQADV